MGLGVRSFEGLAIAVVGPLIALMTVMNFSTVSASTLPCVSGIKYIKERQLKALYSRVVAEESLLRYHDSFYSVGQCMFNEANALIHNRQQLRSRTVHASHINTETPCPIHTFEGELCTSRKVTIEDTNRYPGNLTSVQCTCGGCEPGHRCQALGYYVRVLRKRNSSTCPEGKESWQKSVEKVNLACVCHKIHSP